MHLKELYDFKYLVSYESEIKILTVKCTLTAYKPILATLYLWYGIKIPAAIEV